MKRNKAKVDNRYKKAVETRAKGSTDTVLLAKNHKYTPNIPLLQETLHKTFRDLPQLLPKQYAMLELIADYIRNEKEIEYTCIAKKCNMDLRTVHNYIDHDKNFQKALDLIFTVTGKSGIALLKGRLGHKVRRADVKQWHATLLSQLTGAITPGQVNIQVNTTLVSKADPDTGTIVYDQTDDE